MAAAPATNPGHTPAVPWHCKGLHPSRNPAKDLPTHGLTLPGTPCPATTLGAATALLPASSALVLTEFKVFCRSRALLAPWPCRLSPSPGTLAGGSHCQAPELGETSRHVPGGGHCWGLHWAGSKPVGNGEEQFQRHRDRKPLCAAAGCFAVVLTAFPLHVLLRLNIIAKHTFTCNYPFMKC